MAPDTNQVDVVVLVFLMLLLLLLSYIVQGVKDKKRLLASDLYQSLKICIHGQFHILN